MIKYVKGNILDTDCEALVIPVNCEGVMGAGLAKQCKDRYPLAAQYYLRASYLLPGLIYCIEDLVQEEYNKSFIFATTKDRWRNNSAAIWIKNICYQLTIKNIQYKTVALPLLGCGLGCLSWEKTVKPIYEEYLEPAKQEFIVYVRG